MYYLNSRYYNPEVGRFINVDGLIGEVGDILGHNMYAYCQNNPVMYYDPSGYFLATISGALTGGIIGGLMAAISGENFWVGVASGAVSGAIAGAALDIAIVTGGTGFVAVATYIAINTAGGALGATAGEIISQLGNQYVNGESLKVNSNDVLKSAAWGGAFGLIIGVSSVGKVMQMRNAQKLVNGIIDNPSYWNNPNGFIDPIEKINWQNELWGNLYPQLNNISLEVYKGLLPSVQNGLMGLTQSFLDKVS